MTRFRIREESRSTGQVVAIELTEVGEKQAALLEAVQQCQEGRCDCTTDQYTKISAMAVEPGDDEVQIRLEAKPGERFVTAEIASCLEHIIAKIKREA